MKNAKNQNQKTRERVAGIDVSAKTLDVAMRGLDGAISTFKVTNDPPGFAALSKRLTGGDAPARVVLEATGIYSLDLALALHAASVQVMVVNPRAARAFTVATMRRAKTDQVDAAALLEFAERMAFEPWQPPPPARLELRGYARRISDLTVQLAAERNRLHATTATHTTPAAILADLRAGIAGLETRIETLRSAAIARLEGDTELAPILRRLLTITGIGEKSAVSLLGELLLLPADMTAREVTAHAGLDPRPKESGTSMKNQRHISKMGNPRLRGALHLPAMTAVVHCPPLKAFHERLVERGKAPKSSIVAVSRKLLHIVWYVLHHEVDFDPAKVGPKRLAA